MVLDPWHFLMFQRNIRNIQQNNNKQKTTNKLRNQQKNTQINRQQTKHTHTFQTQCGNHLLVFSTIPVSRCHGYTGDRGNDIKCDPNFDKPNYNCLSSKKYFKKYWKSQNQNPYVLQARSSIGEPSLDPSLTKWEEICIFKRKSWVRLGGYPCSCSQNIAPYCPIQPLYNSYIGDIFWYISRVLSQRYPTFSFAIYININITYIYTYDICIFIWYMIYIYL